MNQPSDNSPDATSSSPETATPGHHSDTAQTFLPTKNMPSLLSYYFGIFGFLPFMGLPLSVAAVVLGKKGLNQFKKDPTPGAKGHAIAGLVMGIVQLVIFVLFVLLMVVLASSADSA